MTHRKTQPLRISELMLEVVQRDVQALNMGHQGNGRSSFLGVTAIEYHCGHSQTPAVHLSELVTKSRKNTKSKRFEISMVNNINDYILERTDGQWRDGPVEV